VGVLDDAIREHLELKLKRGADPGEVSQQEAEALGPARREAVAEPSGEVVQDGSGDEPTVAAEPPTQLAEELVPPTEIAEEPVLEPEHPPLHAVDDTAGAEETEAFPEAPPPEPPAPGSTEDPNATVEWPAPAPPDDPVVEEAPEPDEVPAEEQMSPPTDPEPGDDHLRFEQKPQRDFDLDD